MDDFELNDPPVFLPRGTSDDEWTGLVGDEGTNAPATVSLTVTSVTATSLRSDTRPNPFGRLGQRRLGRKASQSDRLIGSEHGADFFDFLGSYDPEAKPFPADSPYSDWSLTGSVADYPLAGFGHGIRMQQLDRAPPGLDIGGEAWIRLTISSLSASDYAEATGKLVPTDLGYRIETGSDGDPIYMRNPAVFPRTQWIESIVLIATNDTMSQWVITFNQPGTYTSTASYWTGMAEDYALNIRFVRL